ncbi:cell wall hydrolase [Beijerinckia sp. L45]|uniref:cell wall hydrolase n=1 Tax=Beijerinckia sp. L45 TaxID=1641855 RepID=UPI00131C81AB|nr:cell wall hydrolase [Beijerinckia sp. L45]
MGRSRSNWAVQVVTPWCLGMALLLSITPDAGQTATIGGSFSPLTIRAPAMPDDLVPVESIALTGDFGSFSGTGSERWLTQASYAIGQASDFQQMPDEIEPRADLKRDPGVFPVIDRANKGDPAIGLRPTFDTRLRQPGGLKNLRASQLIAPHDDALPAASFSLQDNGGPLDGATSFSPWGDDETPEDTADLSAHQSGATFAMQPAALKERLAQGATPKVSRAEALASTTPAPADGAPIEASFAAPLAPTIAPNMSIIPRSGDRPNYAALLTGERGAHERKCLAEAVYFESRSEPEEGQAAVAQVVLNRATSGLYPASICGVVYQNRTHYKACQFSFACEGKSLRINEPDAWHTAERIADEVVDGKTYLSDVGGATHYHAKYVRPGWARRLVKMDVIGHHIFYKLKAGQT